jgi:hypothetical protein
MRTLFQLVAKHNALSFYARTMPVHTRKKALQSLCIALAACMEEKSLNASIIMLNDSTALHNFLLPKFCRWWRSLSGMQEHALRQRVKREAVYMQTSVNWGAALPADSVPGVNSIPISFCIPLQCFVTIIFSQWIFNRLRNLLCFHGWVFEYFIAQLGPVRVREFFLIVLSRWCKSICETWQWNWTVHDIWINI